MTPRRLVPPRRLDVAARRPGRATPSTRATRAAAARRAAGEPPPTGTAGWSSPSGCSLSGCFSRPPRPQARDRAPAAEAGPRRLTTEIATATAAERPVERGLGRAAGRGRRRREDALAPSTGEGLRLASDAERRSRSRPARAPCAVPACSSASRTPAVDADGADVDPAREDRSDGRVTRPRPADGGQRALGRRGRGCRDQRAAADLAQRDPLGRRGDPGRLPAAQPAVRDPSRSATPRRCVADLRRRLRRAATCRCCATTASSTPCRTTALRSRLPRACRALRQPDRRPRRGTVDHIAAGAARQPSHRGGERPT